MSISGPRTPSRTPPRKSSPTSLMSAFSMPIDSTTSRQVELDRTRAGMLHDAEKRRDAGRSKVPSPKNSGASYAGQDPCEAILSLEKYEVIRTSKPARTGKEEAPRGYFGAGASGVVWDAKPKGDRRRNGNVVIKVSRQHKKHSHYTDIRREAQMLRSLQELQINNIVGYCNDFEDESNHRIELVLEKVHNGIELREITRKEMKHRKADPARMIGQVAGVLASIHLNCRAHQDLHTGNVMIDGNGNAHVIDWSRGKKYKRGSPKRRMDSNQFKFVVRKILETTHDAEINGRSIDEMVNNQDFRGLDLIFQLSAVRCFRQEGGNWIQCELPSGPQTLVRENVDNLSQCVHEVEIGGERYVVIA